MSPSWPLLIALALTLNLAAGDWNVAVSLINYTAPARPKCDAGFFGLGASECDPEFKICVKSNNIDSCQTTKNHTDVNHIDFQPPERYVWNAIPRLPIVLSLEVLDHNIISSNVIAQFAAETIDFNPSKPNNTRTVSFSHASTVVDVSVTVSCKEEGHFTCGGRDGSRMCKPGDTEPSCQETDYCHSSPCQNNGTCRNVPSSFNCLCINGFGGDTCSEPLGSSTTRQWTSDTPTEESTSTSSSVQSMLPTRTTGKLSVTSSWPPGPTTQTHYTSTSTSQYTVPTSSVSGSPVSVESAISLRCNQTGFSVAVDTARLGLADPGTSLDSVVLGRAQCPGHLDNDLLYFVYSYQQCGTKEERDARGAVVFSNSLMATERPPGLGMHVLGGVRWDVQIVCSMPLHEEEHGNYSVLLPHTGSINGTVQGHVAKLQLFTDHAFSQPLTLDPASGGHRGLTPGQSLYVKVGGVAPLPDDVILVLQSCQASASDVVTPDHVIQLIRHGCPALPGTQILARRNHASFFSFPVLAFDDSQLAVHVTCDVTVCKDSDFSDRCIQQCN